MHVDRRRDVPAERVSAQVRARRGEVHQVALRIVVRAVRAVKDAAVGGDHGRRRGVVEHAPAAGPVRCRIDAGGRSHGAPAGRTVRLELTPERARHAAAVVEAVAKRGVPPRRQVRVDGDQIGVSAIEVRARDDVDCPVGRDGRRRAHRDALGAARGGGRGGPRARRPGQIGVAERREARVRGLRRVGHEAREAHESSRAVGSTLTSSESSASLP